MKKLILVPIIFVAGAIVVLLYSCITVIDTVESDSFKVEVSLFRSFDYYLDVNSYRKPSERGFQTIISIDRDDSVGVKLLDDSILVVTDIRSDGYPSLLANLQNRDIPNLHFPIGKAVVARDTTRLSTIQLGDSVAATFHKNSRPDVYFVAARYDSYPYAVGTVVITLLGASGVEIVDWSGDFLVFDCFWLRQPSRQRFSVDLADRSLNPEDFSIIESVSSP